MGVDLWTKTRVELTDEAGVIKGRILSEPEEKINLIRATVAMVLKHFNFERKYGAKVETESNIPIAKGMKSSSVAANALVLAIKAALGKEIDDHETLILAIDSAISSKTTITGAFDDACASYFGNIVVTDNYERKILKQYEVEEDFTVLFHVPDQKSYTISSDIESMRLIAPQVEVAFKEALLGNYWTALTLNGILYSTALGYDQKVAIKALKTGAVAAGLTGKGPATAAITSEDNVGNIVDGWREFNGDIITTKVNRLKAHITRQE